MNYTTQSKVEALMGSSLSAAQAAALPDIILAVKAWIDRYVGKTFEAVSETRYYDSNGSGEVLIDAFVGSPTILILNTDGSTYATLTEGQSSDYVVLPSNSTEKNIIRLGSQGSHTYFPSGSRRIKVTATFGFSATVPADVQLVATRLAIAFLNESSVVSSGVVKSTSLGDYSVTYATVSDLVGGKVASLGLMDILDSYRDIDV